MTKNKFKVTDKLPIWLAIPAVIIVAGLILFFVLGFNPSSSIADNKSLIISHDAYINTSEDLQDALREVCEEKIDGADIQFIDCNIAENSSGGQIEYTFTAEVSNEKLYELKTNILAALEADATLQYGVYHGTVHSNISHYAYDYIWRAAISGGVALVLAFLYVFIRYRISMGLATLICGIADTAVMLALTVILRLPVTTALATAAIFAVLYSILVSTLSFNKMRELFKTEAYAAMSANEAVEAANEQAYKRVLIIGIAAVVFFALLAIFGGAAVREFALPVIIGVVASTFSGTLLAPSLVAAFKAKGVKMQENSEEKARLAKKQEEEEKAQKRSAKKD